MDFVFSRHAEEQLIRRSLDRNIIKSVLLNPEQILEDDNSTDIFIYQSIVKDKDNFFYIVYSLILNYCLM